jgi:hypothetical protein
MAKLGRLLFAISVGFLGFQVIFYGRFLGGVPPVPPWTSGSRLLAYITGAVLVALSLAILLHKETRISATALGLIYLFCVLFLHTQKFHDIVYDGVAVPAPSNRSLWPGPPWFSQRSPPKNLRPFKFSRQPIHSSPI